MNAQNCTFEGKSYRAESLLCAAALTAVAFFILPVSIAVTNVTPEKTEFTRVYSMGREEAPRENSSAPSVKSPPTYGGSANMRSAAIGAPGMDFSKIGTEGFSFNASDISGNFAMSGFSVEGGEAASGGFEVKVFELSALDKVPRRLNTANVRYPAELLRRGVEGEVRLNVIIDETGAVEVVSVESSTDELFNEPAIRAASALKYEAPTKNGEIARAKFILPIPFKIQR